MALQEYDATAEIKGGRLRIRNRRAFDLALQSFTDGEVAVRVEKRRATRSPQANRYYWGVVVEAFSMRTGYDADEMHAILKAKFLPKRVAITDGNGEIQGDFVIGGSTTKLNVNDFYEYVERVRQWAAELGFDIPDPREA